jgi:hypothetical protein
MREIRKVYARRAENPSAEKRSFGTTKTNKSTAALEIIAAGLFPHASTVPEPLPQRFEGKMLSVSAKVAHNI